MIGQIPEIERGTGQFDDVTEVIELEPDQAAPGQQEETIDPEIILVDLKKRRAVLNKLINEGSNTPEEADLNIRLSQTITKLEAILNDPELDLLSEKSIE